ncbi:MAG: FAD-dependent oxidoreductase [Parvularculaceae bacterium]
MPQKIDADICIIGAGSGGLSVAAGAAQLGRKVVLVEKGKMGGDCLNFGCVPSKALIAAAKRAQEIREAGIFGIASSAPAIDFAAVMNHVHSVIAEIAPHDSVERFEGLGVTVIQAPGAFSGPRSVTAGDAEISAKHFVIATGSSPFVPPVDGLDGIPFLTNETIFDLRTRPERLIILGGGPIGVEMAQAFRRLGSEVTLVEADKLLNREDGEAVSLVRQKLIGEGVYIHENAKAVRAARSGDKISLTLQNGEAVEGSHLLVAVGRRANLSGLHLEKAGVALENGKLRLDARLRTANKRVFAIGDAAGGMQFTHVAGDHASTLVRNILFKAPAKRRDAFAPRVTYCDPEIATIGMTEAEAARKGETFTVARWGFADNDRARAERSTDGWIKVLIGKSGSILGAAIVGENAGDLIALWSFAIANRLKIRTITNMIAAYPTRSEISKRAAGAYYTPTLFSDRTRGLVKMLSTFD